MKKVLCIILSIIVLFALASCNKTPVNDEVYVDDFEEEVIEETQPEVKTLLDYAVTQFYDLTLEFGKYVFETPYGGTTAYFENKVEVVLGQLDNVSGKEIPIGINSYNLDIPVTDTLNLGMTYDEINDAMGGTVEEPTFSEDMDDGYTAYSTIVYEEDFTITFFWSVDSADQANYNTVGADYVCASNGSSAQSYDGDMFSTLSKEEALDTIDPDWYIDSAELLDVGDFCLFFDNVKYYHFVILDGGKIGNDAFVSSEGGHFYVGSFRDGSSDVFLYIDENTNKDVFLNSPFHLGGTFESGTIYEETVISRRYYTDEYYNTVIKAYKNK